MSTPKARRATRDERLLALIERIIELSPDAGIIARAESMKNRLSLSMEKVLAKVPGETVVEKVKLIGITRQAYYGWLSGTSRPNIVKAKRLARLTGYEWQSIRGR